MTTTQTKRTIQQALHTFTNGNFREDALTLFDSLGYRSDKQLELESNTASGFLDTFNLHGRLNPERALLEEWQTVEFLFQLTQDEISQSPHLARFTTGQVDNSIIESYLFLALDLHGDHYNRTQLARLTREVNKQFPMPVLLLFRYGPHLTLSVINRRLHKRDPGQDVLEKVTLIKDINYSRPHRAHVEILYDLSLERLYRGYEFSNFVELHRAWQTTLDSSELNKRFFKEIANWYFWAVENVTFPPDAHPDPKVRTATSVIRLITRLIFVWFIKEKGLLPDDLFDRRKLDQLLRDDDPNDSTYYKAILQNLFFATLNQEMNTPAKPDNRKFRHRAKQKGQRDQHYLIHNVYRYERYFTDPAQALELFSTIPFLNGGLFECLDKKDPDNAKQVLRIDGFSDRPDNPLTVPDFLFFGEEREVDLNEIYGTRGKRYKVRGLIDILSSYKFTIAENTPIEEEIALDPELLGKVFENLLAAYNPETETTARKQTGSFYTPREIVNYMVDESLVAYLGTRSDFKSLLRATRLFKPPNQTTTATHMKLPTDFKSLLRATHLLKPPNQTTTTTHMKLTRLLKSPTIPTKPASATCWPTTKSRTHSARPKIWAPDDLDFKSLLRATRLLKPPNQTTTATHMKLTRLLKSPTIPTKPASATCWPTTRSPTHSARPR